MFASQPAPEQAAAVQEAQDAIADCAVKLARYRAALDAGADPSVVTGWIADAQLGESGPRLSYAGSPALPG